MYFRALLLLGTVQWAAGLTLKDERAAGPAPPRAGASRSPPADVALIRWHGFPDTHCNPMGWFYARFLGMFPTAEGCAQAARAAGVVAFTYEPTGRHADSCFEELVPVNETVWNQWQASIAAGQEPECPGGGWEYDPHTDMYTWPPPTSPPTAPPTAAPAPAPPLPPTAPTTAQGSQTVPSGAQLSATGDPHLVNVRGQRFDIYKPGVHRLLQVPQGAKPSAELLAVSADAEQIGGACGDMYFQAINITGKWVARGGLQFFSRSPENRKGRWRHFGPFGLLGQVGLKVAWGHTGDDFPYLNVYVKNLRYVRYSIGGLLGDDDHTAAATPGAHCKRSLSLLAANDEQGVLRSFAGFV